MPSIRDSLPALYRDLLPEVFARELPPETKATCASCAMWEGAAGGAVAPVDGVSRFFQRDTKCCTYHPRLPNFLVGALLADTRASLAEGQRRVRERLASRLGVTPQWMQAPETYNLLYRTKRHAFGRARALRCPYYDVTAGSCTIWAYRESVCSTYFCKYVAGADGRRFWTSVKEYLVGVERQLARWALLQLAPELLMAARERPEVHGLSPEDMDGQGPPAPEYAAMWGAWAGREEELYRRCHEVVGALSASDLERLLGLDGMVDLRAMEELQRAAYSPTLPRFLKLAPTATVQWLPDGSVALGAYSELEAVALPGFAYSLLVAFTGRESVAEVRARLRKERRADLGDEVLLELYHQRILVDAGVPASG